MNIEKFIGTSVTISNNLEELISMSNHLSSLAERIMNIDTYSTAIDDFKSTEKSAMERIMVTKELSKQFCLLISHMCIATDQGLQTILMQKDEKDSICGTNHINITTAIDSETFPQYFHFNIPADLNFMRYNQGQMEISAVNIDECGSISNLLDAELTTLKSVIASVNTGACAMANMIDHYSGNQFPLIQLLSLLSSL